MTVVRRSVGRPRTRLLDREGITQAAQNIIVAKGIGALTMTSLATELGVTASALYNHADSKAEILDWIRESIFAEIDTSSFATKHWVKALEDWAHSYLNVVVDHRALLQILATTGSGGPAGALTMYEHVTQALIDGGWPVESVLTLIESLEAFIFGSTVKEHFHQADIEARGIESAAPTYLRALQSRANVDVAAEKDALFRIGFNAILTWSAGQLGVELDDGATPRADG